MQARFIIGASRKLPTGFVQRYKEKKILGLKRTKFTGVLYWKFLIENVDTLAMS
jgi:hypothetical protein